ncbi:MAG: 2-O-methyltransferase NoeI [candidate division WS2 bacterium]|nr:2-O-methyltransferase NoeI [Bacillota bacterium]MBT9151365.1 2-O-methyltransferase NoeI [Candidatus Psychracetigena formicireducens]
MKEQHNIKASIKPMLSIEKIVTKGYALFKFILLNPGILIPPIFGMIIEKVKCKRVGIEHPFYNCRLNRDDIRVIFDVGANIGNVTLAAARSFPNAHIYAFEPVSTTYKRLCENVGDYKDRITPYNFGFFNVSKRLDIHITSFHGANSILDQSQDYKINAHSHIKEIATENIEVCTMDSFVSNKNIDKIDIIKIDVEGVEKEVIEGGSETFKNKVDYVFVELSFLRRNRESGYWVEICRSLYELGFMLINVYDVAKYIENGREYVAQMDAFFAKEK